MKKTIFKLLIIFFIYLSCNHPSSGDELSHIGFYSTSSEIINLIKEEQKNFRKNFLLANALKEEKKYKQAILYFANSCFNSTFNFEIRLFSQPVYSFVNGFHIKSPYFDDSVYEIAKIFYMYGENEYVVKFINLIDEETTPLYRNAILLKSKALLKIKKYKEAEKELLAISEIFKDQPSLSIIKIRLGSVYETINNNQKAAETYLAIIKNPDSEEWKNNIASRRLIYLKDEKKLKISSSEDQLTLAKALYNSGEYERAERELPNIDKLNNTADAKILNIRLKVRKNPGRYKKIFKTIKSDVNKDSMALAIANTLWEINKKHAAIDIYRQIKNSEDEDIAASVLIRLSFFLEQRNKTEFIKHMNTYINQFPKDEKSGRLLWIIGRYYLKRNQPHQAIANMQKSIEMFPRGEYSANCRYWIYRINQQIGKTKKEEMLSLTEDLCFLNPESPYTIRHLNSQYRDISSEKLKKLYKKAQDKKNLKAMHLYNTLLFMKEGYSKSLKERLSHFPNHFTDEYKKIAKIFKKTEITKTYDNLIKGIEKYFIVGNTRNIYRDVQFIYETNSSSRKDIEIALTIWSKKYGQYNFGTFYGFKVLKSMNLKEYLPLLPKELAETLYPRSFKKCTEKNASIFNIKPDLIYAMMKAESNFNHTALSPVGASGLMQLMPATAQDIAKNLNIKKYNLKEPCTSIKFGTSYIQWLNNYYNDVIEYIVSGYNAGAGNVNKWIKLYKSKNIDFFTEFIPFDETRNYIYNTNKYKIQYEVIYQK